MVFHIPHELWFCAFIVAPFFYGVLFPIAVVTSYRKINDWAQCKVITLQFWRLEVDTGLTELKWKCWEGETSILDTLRQSLFSVSKHSSRFLLSVCFHLQSQWWLVESFPHHITLMLLPPSSSFWDACGYNGPAHIIQDNLPIFSWLESLILSVTLIPLCHIR